MFYCKAGPPNLNECTILSLRIKFTALVLSHTNIASNFYLFTFLVKALVFLGMNYLSFTYRCEV